MHETGLMLYIATLITFLEGYALYLGIDGKVLCIVVSSLVGMFVRSFTVKQVKNGKKRI